MWVKVLQLMIHNKTNSGLTMCFLSELYALLKDQDDGVKELKLEQDNRVFNHCFTGTPLLVLVTRGAEKVFFFVLIFTLHMFSPLFTASLFALYRCNSG